MLFTPVQNTPMRTPMVDMGELGTVGWYDGIFSTYGGGSALGSGLEYSEDNSGHGLSCGEGYYEYFSYTIGYIHTGTGRGNAIGSGYLNEPECDAVPYMKEI